MSPRKVYIWQIDTVAEWNQRAHSCCRGLVLFKVVKVSRVTSRDERLRFYSFSFGTWRPFLSACKASQLVWIVKPPTPLPSLATWTTGSLQTDDCARQAALSRMDIRSAPPQPQTPGVAARSFPCLQSVNRKSNWRSGTLSRGISCDSLGLVMNAAKLLVGCYWISGVWQEDALTSDFSKFRSNWIVARLSSLNWLFFNK